MNAKNEKAGVPRGRHHTYLPAFAEGRTHHKPVHLEFQHVPDNLSTNARPAFHNPHKRAERADQGHSKVHGKGNMPISNQN
jgi:hypothetical protein